jgi:hypothetical protein
MRDGPPMITLHDATRHGKSAQRTRVRAAGARPAPGRHVQETFHI